jgi:hypothetical protein
MAVVVAGARMASRDDSVAHLEDAVEAAKVGWVVRRHYDGEGVALVEQEAVDNLATRLVKGGIGFVEQQNFRALDDGARD